MTSAALRWGVSFTLALFAAVAHESCRGAEISVGSYQVGGYYGTYEPTDDAPPSYPATIAPDNAPEFQNYFMGRTTTPTGFATPERRAFFIYDMAGVAASIPLGDVIVGVTIDLTLIPGGTSALANFSAGFEIVVFSGTHVPAGVILDPGAVPTPAIFSTFGTGAPFGDFFIGDPGGPMPTPPDTYTIGLPGAVGAIGPSIASGTYFVVTARLATYNPDSIGAGAPPPFDPYEYVFGLTDVTSPTGSHAPIPYLTITTAPVPEPSSLTLLSCFAIGLAGYVWRRRKRKAV